MKVTFDRAPLLSAWQSATVFVPGRTTKEVLKWVKLEVAGESVTLSATDLEVGGKIFVNGASNTKPGIVMIPADQFSRILKECSDKTLTIESDDSRTTVCGSKSKFRLPVIDANEFPPSQEFDASDYHEIGVSDFKAIVARTENSVDMESSRFTLGGILLEFYDGDIYGVSTDGRRLSFAKVGANKIGDHKPDVAIIVRVKAMQQMARSFGDAGDVQIHASKNIIQFATDRGVFFSRLLEGRFPRWRDSFGFEKSSKVQTVTLPAGVLLGAIRQAAVMTAEESRGLDFHFDNSIVGSSLRIYASSANQGESEVEVEIEYSGPETKITLDHRFPADFLKVLDSEHEVTIQFVDSTAAVILSHGESYRTAIMPLQKD